MAGIGFHLRKILGSGSYRSVLEAYLYAGLISSGPWLLSVVGLGIISLLGELLIGHGELQVFRAMVIYAYAGSLVLTGPFQLGTTRYIADRLFVGDMGALRPCFHWVGALTLVVSGLAAGVFMAFSTLGVCAAVGGVMLFQMVCLTWICMIFLSAAKDYMAIVRAFALGYAFGVVGALCGADRFGLAGMIWGFACGQALLVWLMAVRIRVEFPSAREQESAVMLHWRELPLLLVIGFSFNLGVWIDKFIFWYGPMGERIAGVFFTCPHYDTCMFLGYLSIIPAMALFLIRVETGFYKHYAAYYETITHGGSLERIEIFKHEMVQALRLSIGRLLKIQGTFSLCCIVAAPALITALGLNLDQTMLLRTSLLAAFLQALLLILTIILLYFDWQVAVCGLALLFLVCNAVFSGISLFLDPRMHGFGYLLACLVTLVAGINVLDRRIADLEYDTFTREPINA